MQRRAFTSIVSVGIVTSIAGCSSDSPEGSDADGEESNDDTQSTQSDSSDEQQSQDGEASFEVVEYDLPETVSIGSSVSGSIVIRNAGDTAGETTAPLYVRTPDSDWNLVNEYDVEEVEPGETARLNIETNTLEYINRYEFALGRSDNTAVIQTVSAEIDWGSEYTTPEGYVIRVDRPELQNTYTAEGYDGETEESPEDRGQWAFVNVYVKNETGQSEYSPTGFALVSGSSQFDSTILFNDPVNKGDQYESGELQPGIERSGWLAYELPADLSAGDLTMAWSKSTIGGEISVNWV
jgi:hypothetical protein